MAFLSRDGGLALPSSRPGSAIIRGETRNPNFNVDIAIAALPGGVRSTRGPGASRPSSAVALQSKPTSQKHGSVVEKSGGAGSNRRRKQSYNFQLGAPGPAAPVPSIGLSLEHEEALEQHHGGSNLAVWKDSSQVLERLKENLKRERRCKITAAVELETAKAEIAVLRKNLLLQKTRVGGGGGRSYPHSTPAGAAAPSDPQLALLAIEDASSKMTSGGNLSPKTRRRNLAEDPATDSPQARRAAVSKGQVDEQQHQEQEEDDYTNHPGRLRDLLHDRHRQIEHLKISEAAKKWARKTKIRRCPCCRPKAKHEEACLK